MHGEALGAPAPEVLHRAQVAGQDAIRPEPLESTVVAFLAGLLHAGRRDHDAQAGGADALDGDAEPDQLHEIQLQLADAEAGHELERRVDLAERAQQRDQDRSAGRAAASERRSDVVRCMADGHLAKRLRRPPARERVGQRAAEPLQLGRRQRQSAFQVQRQLAQGEFGLTEGAQLLAQETLVERPALRRREGHRALRARLAAQVVASGDDERLPDGAADRHGDADLPLFRGEALHPPRQLRVLGLPHHVARPDQPQVERALTGTAEDELPRPGVEHVAGVQPAPRLVVLGLALVEEDAVAGLELRSAGLGPDQDVPGPGVDLLHPSHQHPAVARIEPVHQLLVI